MNDSNRSNKHAALLTDAITAAMSVLEQNHILDASLHAWGCAVPEGKLGIVGGLICASAPQDGDVAAVLLLRDSGSSLAWPYRAKLVRVPGSGWALTSIQHQCPSCFGLGLLEDEQPCATCEFEGWGSGQHAPHMVWLEHRPGQQFLATKAGAAGGS
jgi:hypothetical protein